MTGATPLTAAEQPHFRYPGPEPFRDDDTDRHLFFGREEEATEVLNRLLSTRLLVLFAKSGLGKTSLLQAGVFPRLREHDFLPIRLRFNQRRHDFMAELRGNVETQCRTQSIAVTPGAGATLWEYFNTAIFSRGDRFLVPVLVLDQFEEIFTLQDPAYRLRLAEELGYVLSGGTPPAVRARLRDGDKLNYPAQAPSMRLLLSLREEYVGALQELAPFVPGILANRFRLAALNRDHAREAIERPAQLDDREHRFATRPFDYVPTRDEVPGTVDAILKFLTDSRGEIEPFQLQVLCRHVEREVKVRQAQTEAKVEVDLQSYLGGQQGMQTVITTFYKQALASLPGWRVRRKARRLCEQGLLSPEGHRESLGEGQIQRRYRLNKAQLDSLVEQKVLRREDRLDKFSYELSHDSLAKAVHARRRARVKSVRIIVAASVASVVLLAILASLLSWREVRRAENTAQGNLAAYAELVKQQLGKDGPSEPEMVTIQSGSFDMGSTDGPSDEQPVRKVALRGYNISKYEVTFEEYDQYAADQGLTLPGDWGWGRGKQPVINVSWGDAAGYAAWLSAKTGKRFRLPSEAEWEYAARAGTTTAYWWGPDIGHNQANCNGCGSRYQKTAPVGRFKPNPWDLHDTAGNVWEWVQDCYHESYADAPADGRVWISAGDVTDCRRVIRGGSWFDGPGTLRSAYRGRSGPDYRYDNLGFRLAQDN
ncbi:MAG: formylglycine-generating enzyme family protein [Gammaproteobacteria bacterium]